MKIIIVSPKLSGGGAEHCAVLWANSFSDREHEVILMSDLYSDINYICNERVQQVNLFPNGYHSIIHKWFGGIRNIRKQIKRNCPDVVIGVLAACSFAVKVACIGSGIPVIMTEHDAFERPKDAKFSLKEYIFKFYLNRLYDCVTVITQRDKDVIGNRLKRVVVMPNPLSITPLSSRPPKEKIVLAAGRLDGWFVKGFDVLITSWAHVVEKCPEWKLLIAGTGTNENREYLQNLIEQHKCSDKVDLLGYVDNMLSLYQKSDIFVLSSRYEGFGLVLIEAMSQGCACVACDYKGRQKEILGDEENGFLCIPGNNGDLAEKLEILMLDSSMRYNLGNNAIKRVQMYNESAIADRWLKLLSSLSKN